VCRCPRPTYRPPVIRRIANVTTICKVRIPQPSLRQLRKDAGWSELLEGGISLTGGEVADRFAIEVVEYRYGGGGIVEKVDAPGVELRRLGAGFGGRTREFRMTTCQVMPLRNFQVNEICVLFSVVIARALD
jgi:hypothetical protein